MAYFPFCVDVVKLHGVIIGGGKVALEKVERLLSFDARLTLVALKVCDEIKALGDEITIIEKTYESSDLLTADYVIAATDDEELNKKIYDDARQKKLLTNVVDVPDLCDFIFPSVLKRGKLVVGVTSSGAGPQVAIRLRKEIEKIVPDDIEEILDILAKERIRAKEEIKDSVERRKYLIDLSNRLLNEK